MFAMLVPRISTFYIDHHLLAQSLDDGFNWAEALHSYGIKLDAWTLDADKPIAAENARRLYNAGVDQFTTNTPAALSTLLNEK
jgi:glycerophosphoryl diester phosphodiesterase